MRNSNPGKHKMDANLFKPSSDQIRTVSRTHRKQPSAARFLIWMIVLFTMLGLGSCNQPRDRSSYGGDGTYARVSVHVDSRSTSRQIQPNNRYLNEFGIPAPSGTALIIAVPAGTSFSDTYNSVTGYYDKQLVDLTTSTVTLTLPLNTSIQLFEYTFIQSYSLNSLSSENRVVFSKAILGPITLTGSTTTVELQANLEYALQGAFDELWANGSYNIEHDDYNGVSYFLYEKMIWQTLTSTSYLFNTTSRIFEVGVSPRISYELINSQWTATSGHPFSSTFDRVDRDNFTVYYTNPDFSSKLVGLIDLSVSGFDGDKEGDDGGDEGDDDKGFMEADDFTRGALGYILEIAGLTEAEYRLERVAESHDCANTEFSSLGDYIDHHTASEFTCQGHGDGPCLRFESYTPGQTNGNILEVIRDESMNIVSQSQAGTWEIKAVQTKDLLFYTPNDTNYFYDGVYASFWSVYNSKVWEGHYMVGDPSVTPMYLATLNATAIADFTRFLEVAPASIFDSDQDNGSGGCNNLIWDEGTWDNYNWAP